MKYIAYLVLYEGVDGMKKTSILRAFCHEKSRDEYISNSVNKAWYRKGEAVVDREEARSKALGKLDAIDKLSLGLVEE